MTAITGSTTGTIRPLTELDAQPIMMWTRAEVLAYPLSILEKMSTWAACVHGHPSGLTITTTPNPAASIRITDLAGEILFQHTSA